MESYMDEGYGEIYFSRVDGRIHAGFSINEEEVSANRFIRYFPQTDVLNALLREDDSVSVAIFFDLHKQLANLAGRFCVHTAPELLELPELPLPLGFCLKFPFDSRAMRMTVSCNKPGCVYDGGGCFLSKTGYIHIEKLRCLDPVLEDIQYIPTSHLNLFLRVLLPEIKKDLEAHCALELTNQTAVTISVSEWTQETAAIEVCWRTKAADIRDSGCAGLCLSANRLYAGDAELYRTLPFHKDGRFTVSGEERILLEELMRSHPGLFTSIPTLQPRQAEAVRPAGRERAYEGPVLLSVKITPAAKEPPARYLNFVREARLKKDRRTPPAPHAPFNSYWPLYDTLSPGQREWYFYWRTRVLKGEYLPCDLSYIYIFVYELINNIHDHGLKRLYGVWDAYRASAPKLDYYLPEWILDYILTYHEGNLFDLCNLVERFPLKYSPLLRYSEVFCNETLKKGFSALPLPILLSIAGFDTAKCKVPPERLSGVVRGLEASYRRRNTSLLEAFRPEACIYTRESFRGAVKGRRANRTISIRYLPYFTQEALQKLLYNAFRLGENIIRADLHISGRLKVEGLSFDEKACIENALTVKPVPAPQKIDVDLSLARRIETVSWELTQELIVEDEPAEAEGNPPAETETEDAPASGFAASLTDTEQRFLSALLCRKPVDALCAESFMLPEAVAEHINELAIDYFGDAVIDIATLTLYEEYEPALAGQIGGLHP